MRQTKKKKNRIGQKNEITIIYIFFNKDSAIDEIILLSIEHIKKIIDRILKIKVKKLNNKKINREK
jgi:hypothetical protein